MRSWFWVSYSATRGNRMMADGPLFALLELGQIRPPGIAFRQRRKKDVGRDPARSDIHHHVIDFVRRQIGFDDRDMFRPADETCSPGLHTHWNSDAPRISTNILPFTSKIGTPTGWPKFDGRWKFTRALPRGGWLIRSTILEVLGHSRTRPDRCRSTRSTPDCRTEAIELFLRCS